MRRHVRGHACVTALIVVALVSTPVFVGVGASTQAGTTVTVEDAVVSSGERATLNVTLSRAPEDIAGYVVVVSVENGSVATVGSARTALPDNDTTVTGDTATLLGIDRREEIDAGDRNVRLGQVTVTGTGDGETSVTAAAERIDAVDGARVTATTDPGTVLVSDTGSVTVAADGSGEFRSIQAAVDAVPVGYRIVVEDGTYDESVTLDEDVQLLGAGATLDGANADSDAAVRIIDGAEPRIAGFVLEDWDTGLDAAGTTGDWVLEGVEIRDTDVGVMTGATGPTNTFRQPATGNWTLTNVAVDSPADTGVSAMETTGDWSIERSTIDGGLDAYRASGAWTVSRSDVHNRPDTAGGIGVRATGTTGDWAIVDARITETRTAAIWATGSESDFTVRNTTVRTAKQSTGPTIGGAGLDALNAGGNWTVADSRFVATGGTAISARQATGNWTVRGTLVAANDEAGVSTIDSTGRPRIVDSAFLFNDGPDVDATGSNGVNATGNWWRAPAGDRCLSADCGDTLATPPVPTPETHRVAPDGSAEYTSIAAAVANADRGDRVVVANGTYAESLTLETEVEVLARTPGGVVLDGSSSNDTSGITFPSGAVTGPTVAGVVVTGFDTGVAASGNDGAWELRNVTLRGNGLAIAAANSDGEWLATDSTIRANEVGVDARYSDGSARIRNSRLLENDGAAVSAIGVDRPLDATRNWWGRASGPTDAQCIGNADCSGNLVRANGSGVTITVAPDGSGDYTTIDGAVAATEDGDRVVVANGTYEERVRIDTDISLSARTPGGVTLVAPDPNGTVVQINDSAAPTIDGFEIAGLSTTQVGGLSRGIDAIGTSGDWAVRNLTVPGAVIGVDATGSSGDWTITGTDVTSTTVGGVLAFDSDGNWVVRNSSITDGQTAVSNGIDAVGSTGNWTIAGTVITGQEAGGVRAGMSRGYPSITGSAVRQNPGGGIDAPNVAGRLTVTDSALTGNGNAAVDATGASLTVDATDNWWGQTDGPTTGQCVGNVDCSAPLSTSPTLGGNDSRNDTDGFDADLVVAPDGSSEYASLQAAADNATDGDTILVSAGTYTETNVTVQDNVTIVGQRGATIVGDGAEGFLGPPAIRIAAGSGAAPTIRGLTLRDHVSGISAADTTGDWTVRNLTVENTTTAVRAVRAEGDWTVRNTTHQGPPSLFGVTGIQARGTTGDWTADGLRTADTNRSVRASSARGNWTVTDSRFVDTGAGVEAGQSFGAWQIESTTIRLNDSYVYSGAGSGTIGIDAGGAQRSWRVASVSVTGAETGLNARPVDRRELQTAGDWRVVRSSFVDNDVAIDAGNTDGAWQVAQTTITDNLVGIDATNSTQTGNATNNWWGQSSGPTASQCTGNVDCSAPLADAPDTGTAGNDLLVAADGSGEYTSIQAAVDAAGDGDTIRVASGEYRETNVSIDANVTIVGEPGATLVGDGPRATLNYGFQIPESIDRPVAPTISGFTLRNYVYALRFTDSSGDWTVRNATVENASGAVAAAKSDGDWVVQNLTYRPASDGIQRAISATGSSGDWLVVGLTTTDNGLAVSATDTTGNWTLANASITSSSRGVSAADATGQWLIVDASIETSFRGVVASGTTSGWQITRTGIRGPTVGVDVHPTTPTDSAATGDWVVSESTISGTTTAVDARDSDGMWRIRQTSILDNGVVNATNSTVTGDATDNWWGQSSGPEDGQCTGNVDCSAPLASPSLP